jgi:formyltetrahydrofolate-dependent phosphoribosylglycinamide formyltransferase
MTARLAVFASGRGSNLRALLDYFRDASRASVAKIVLVVSSKADAGALQLARATGITTHLDAANDANGESLSGALSANSVDHVVLAGHLRLIPATVARDYAGRMLNIHPALLPSFGGKGMYGSRVHRAVLASGMRISGPTVHFVDEVYDNGAIIAQWPVPVLPGDTEDLLASRVLRAEHLLLPRVVHGVAAGSISLDSSGVVRFAHAPSDAAFGFAPCEGASIGAGIAAALGLGVPAADAGPPGGAK